MSGHFARPLPARIALLSAALLFACDSPIVPPRLVAYQFAYRDFGPPIVYRWPDGHRIGVHLVPASDAEGTAMLGRALDHTIAVWNDAVLYGEYRIERVGIERADVILAWANEPLPVDVTDCPPLPFGAAWTTFCADESGEAIDFYPLLSGDHREDGVHMIVQILRDAADSPERLCGLVAHEFGHVLGIGTHPCRLADVGCGRRDGAHTSIMFTGIPEISTPSSADRSTVELLYHTTPDLTP
jgi:hypothetical protein